MCVTLVTLLNGNFGLREIMTLSTSGMEMAIAHVVWGGTGKDMTALARRLEAAGWRVRRGRAMQRPDGMTWDFHLTRQMMYPLNREAEAVLTARPLQEIPPAPVTRTPLA
jgi:hypothetical protein